MIKIKEGTPDERFDHVEKILQRMARRLHKSVAVIIPPIPIFFSIEIIPTSGLIFQCLLPVRGTITDVCMYISKFERKEAAKFHAEVRGAITIKGTSIETAKRLTIGKVDIPVNAGDMLIFSTSSPDLISGVWVSFLYEVGMDVMKKEHIPIDILDGPLEEIENG